MAAPPYRDFPFPLNVFMHVLTLESGGVRYLHYGLFEREDEPLDRAQERSTALLLDALPRPPCRVLEVGVGLGTTFARLASMGYDVEGMAPDARQIAMARERAGAAARLHAMSFEAFETANRFDAIVFQESSQYIESGALFGKARELAAPGAALVVLDEFALQPVARPDALHRLDLFLAAAAGQGFRLCEERELSRKAAPTIRYFLDRLPRHREALVADLGLSVEQIDGLIASGEDYAALYASGAYGYRFIRFEA